MNDDSLRQVMDKVERDISGPDMSVPDRYGKPSSQMESPKSGDIPFIVANTLAKAGDEAAVAIEQIILQIQAETDEHKRQLQTAADLIRESAKVRSSQALVYAENMRKISGLIGD